MAKKEIAAQTLDPNVDYAKAFHEECKEWQRAADKRKHHVPIDEIKEKVSILDVCGKYTKLRKHYKHYVGRCPFHEDSGESLSVNTETGLYHCFRCGCGGDIFTFIMEVENKSFHEASDFLYENYIAKDDTVNHGS